LPEKVTVDKNLNIIIVRSFGSVAFEHMAESIRSVQRIYRETGINKMLVDAGDLSAMPSTSEMFELAKEFPRTIKIAVLISRVETVHEVMHFSETAAKNRGADIRLFESKPDAIEWLQNG
jgi:hypothetical protein